MKVLGTFIRRAKALFWTAFSILVIFAAVVMGVGKLLIPYSGHYKPDLEAWLSKEFGQPVVLESFTGEWTAFGPRLSLQGMKLLPRLPEGEGAAPGQTTEVVIESAALDIKPLNLLLPGFPLYNFRVIGADFELSRSTGGQFRLSGFGVSQRGGRQGSALKELVRVGEVILQDSSLAYRDEQYGVELNFKGIKGRLILDDDELSSEISARMVDDRSGLIVGEIEATLLLSLDDDQAPSGAQWQATTRELMLAAFQGRLPPNPFLPLSGWLNAELWGTWSPAEGHRVRGVSDLAEARLVNDYQDLWLDRVNTRFQWHFAGKKNWDLHFADFLFDDGEQTWTAPRISLARNTADGLGLWISADRLPLGVPLRLARDIMSIYGTPWPASLPGSANGVVNELDLVLDDRWHVLLARGEIERASVSEWRRWPDLDGLEGRVALSRNTGRLQLRGDQVLVHWPGMLRSPVTVAMPSCTVDLDWGGRWQARISECAVENADFAAHGEVRASGNTGKPAMDLNVVVSRGQLGQLAPYWPEAVMNENVKSWLRRGLVAGELEVGRVSIHGDMDDWPFRNGRGRFEALARIEGSTIDYVDDWPVANGISAVARFAGASMDIRGQVGELGGVAVREARAVIPDFAAPVLTVDYAADSQLPALLGFLQQTPLQERIGADLSRFEFAGPARARGRITLPFAGVDSGKLKVAGKVRLQGGRFTDPGLDITIGEISGLLAYTERGFSGAGLEARFRDHPARLDLQAQADGGQPFHAELNGVFAMGDVIPGFLLEDLGVLSQSHGECPWRVSLNVLAAADGDGYQSVLSVESELQGVSLELPSPLAKSAQDRWPLRLDFPLTGAERVLSMEVEDRITLRLDLPEGAEAPRRAVLRLGGGAAELPQAGLIRIEGETPAMDLDGWLDMVLDEAKRGGGLGGLMLEPAGFTARDLIFLDRKFADVGMKFSVEDTDVRAEFSSEQIDGKVRFTIGAAGSSSLSAEFERLALGEPISTGVEMDTNPADLPAVHLYAHSLRYAGIELGETRIEAYPIANGFHFEKVDASSDRLKLQASGDWLLEENGHRSDFDIHITSESLGNFLQSMDISSPIQGGQTLVTFNAWWPGSPAAFALSRLNGEVEFSVVGGNITSASAGTGRLLGLLSVQALPKRLALDFRDVFDAGFAFDEASGTFEMQNGMATTDNVLLRSSAADISVSGRTDLVAREYDQLLTIRPGVGNTLPIIGALAAGPGGAAAGLALQGLLQEQLSEATRVQYSVTGSWEDPKFEAVEVERKGG